VFRFVRSLNSGNGLGKFILTKLVEIAALEKIYFVVLDAIDTTFLILSKISVDGIQMESEILRTYRPMLGLYVEHKLQPTTWRKVVFTPLNSIDLVCEDVELLNERFHCLVQLELGFIQRCHSDEDFFGQFSFQIFAFQKLLKPISLTQQRLLDAHQKQIVESLFEPNFRVWIRSTAKNTLEENLLSILAPQQLIQHPFLLRTMPIIKVCFNLTLAHKNTIIIMHRHIHEFISTLLHDGLVSDSKLFLCLDSIHRSLHSKFVESAHLKGVCIQILLLTKSLLFTTFYHVSKHLLFGQDHDMMQDTDEEPEEQVDGLKVENKADVDLDTLHFLIIIGACSAILGHQHDNMLGMIQEVLQSLMAARVSLDADALFQSGWWRVLQWPKP